MQSCKRKSCIYHTSNKINGCNYIFVTGQSKLSQLEPGEVYNVENCKFYASGKKRSATKQAFVSPNPDDLIKQVLSVDGSLVEKFYEHDLCDADIAMLLGVSQKAIVKIRRQKGLLRSMSKGGSIRRIDWEGVNAMFTEGYSDIAVAMFYNVPLEVIQRYKIYASKMKAEGGIESGNADKVSEDNV